MNLMTPAPETALRFEGFRLDRRRGLSRRREGGSWEPVALGGRALDVLAALVERPGELVTKQVLMEAAWPGTAVEDANLTVQIAALRRVLDAGRAGGSCIQTVVGRGYRFLPAVTADADADTTDPVGPPPESGETQAEPFQTPDTPASLAKTIVMDTPHGSGTLPRHWASLFPTLAVALVISGLGLGALLTWRGGTESQTAQVAVPRLSIVVLPFQNLGGNPAEDYLAESITDDLTSDLSHIPEAFVIANASARTYKGRAVDAKVIGRELGVRYVVEGSVRRIDATLRVNVQLIATETGAHVWSDRFDERIADLAGGQDAILARMRGALGVSLVEIETARGLRAPPTTPDAFDLILKARALRNQVSNRQRYAEALSLYEQALTLDPSSVVALTGAAYLLIDEAGGRDGWSTFEKWRRAGTLVARARSIAPTSEEVLIAYTYWLYSEADCRQTMVAARQLIEMYPNQRFGYSLLGWCENATGNPEAHISLQRKSIRLNPRDPGLFNRYRMMGTAAMYLERHRDAITWLEHSIALNPELREEMLNQTYRRLAAVYAHAGKPAEARSALATADRLWPFDTVRGHYPDDINPVQMAHIQRYQDGLRRAGERDHAEEDADFGVRADALLRADIDGLTPTTAPGAPTIRTADLPRFIAERQPVIIDLLKYSWGRSIPGAIGLRNAGIGGTITDGAQERLGRKMAALTGGDLGKPIVAVGWNSERFDGRNLALRLVALGYTNVHWYRGGREAWEVAGLPETELVPQEW